MQFLLSVKNKEDGIKRFFDDVGKYVMNKFLEYHKETFAPVYNETAPPYSTASLTVRTIVKVRQLVLEGASKDLKNLQTHYGPPW